MKTKQQAIAEELHDDAMNALKTYTKLPSPSTGERMDARGQIKAAAEAFAQLWERGRKA